MPKNVLSYGIEIAGIESEFCACVLFFDFFMIIICMNRKCIHVIIYFLSVSTKLSMFICDTATD